MPMSPVELRHPLVTLAGATLASMASNAGLSIAGAKSLRDLPSVRGLPSAVGEAKKDYGVDVGYKNSPRLAGSNAFFATKEELTRALSDAKADPSLDAKKIVKMLRMAKEHGLVVTGKGYNKPGVVEHELGHAIASNKGTPWERFTHSRWTPALSDAGSILALVGGLAAGTKYPGWKGRLSGAGVGGGLGALFNAPMISGELTADRYARELMGDKAKAKVKNWPFIGTYVNSAITLPAMAGLLAQV